MTIIQALKQLDVGNDAHWTASGAPLMSVMEELTGNSDLTRAMVTEAAPLFSRDSPELPEETPGDTEQPKGDMSGETQTETPPEVTEDPPEKPPETPLEQPTSENDEDEDDEGDEDESPEDRRARLLEEHKAAQEKVHEIRGALVEGKKMLEKAMAESDRIAEMLYEEPSHGANQQAITDYIKSQAKQRAARLNRRQKVLEALGPDEASGSASQLDQAMSRKTKRGTHRPVYPATGANQ